MTDTVKALKQHILGQVKIIQLDGYEKLRLRDQCRSFVRVLKQIPSTIVNEEMISNTPFTPKAYVAAMKAHDTVRLDAEMECNEELSDDEASKEDASAARLGEELKGLAASEARLNATMTLSEWSRKRI